MKHSSYILAICLGALLSAAPAPADVINLNYISVATGEDDGPQDGVFDSFSIPNLGSVNNNGWASLRTAFEFNISGLPTGFTLNKANLTFSIANFEGARTIGVHGYTGDGTVQLSDFSINGLVGTATVGPDGSQVFNIDVTDFVDDLVANNRTFVGFNVREEPANTSNFTIMQLALTGLPLLSLDLAQIVDIDIKPGRVPNSINRGSRGKISVAILSGPMFDAPSEVDPISLTFGRTGDEASLAFCSNTPKDVNGDGLPDMVCHFYTQSTGFLSRDTQGVLKGKTLSGVPIKGTDSVRIVR